MRSIPCTAAFLFAWWFSSPLPADEPSDLGSTESSDQREADATRSPETTPDTASPPAKKPKRGIEKLDDKSRVKVLAALTGLVILGLGMMSLTWLGARVTRRYMNPTPFDHERKKSSAPAPDDWASKPLVDNSEFSKPT